MTSPSPSLPQSTSLRRLKAAHDASRAAEALKRGDRGKAAELYLSAAAAASSCSSASGRGDTAAAAFKARALSNASAALCAAGRFRDALEAADEAIRISSPSEEHEEEQEEEEQENEPSSSPSPPSLSLPLCLPPPTPPMPPPRRKRQQLGWSKPRWRRGAALRGLGEHLGAALAFADAHRALEVEEKKRRRGGGGGKAEGDEALSARLSECAAAVRESVFKGARCASDAAELLCNFVLAPAEIEGRLLPRSPLSAGDEEAAASLRAAAAAVVAGQSENEPRETQNAATAPSYLSSLSRWLVRAPSLTQLLVERSSVLCAATQWRAAAEDARRALELSLREEEEEEGEQEKNSATCSSPERVAADEKKKNS